MPTEVRGKHSSQLAVILQVQGCFMAKRHPHIQSPGAEESHIPSPKAPEEPPGASLAPHLRDPDASLRNHHFQDRLNCHSLTSSLVRWKTLAVVAVHRDRWGATFPLAPTTISPESALKTSTRSFKCYQSSARTLIFSYLQLASIRGVDVLRR